MKCLILVWLTVILALISGCKTGTRIGYLIPANRNSESEKGEIVRIDFIPNKGIPKVLPAIPATIAVTAVQLGIELIKTELEKEAAKYQAQFSKTIVLNTTELNKGGYLVLTRWVGMRNLHLTDYLNTIEQNEPYQKIVAGFFEKVIPEPASNFPYVGSNAGLEELKQKHLAFMFAAEIEPASSGATTAFVLRPVYIWAWQTKAKVVDLSLAESWKIWQWIGALAFKTDNQVNFKIQPTIKALTRTKDGLVGTVPIDPLSPTVVSLKHNLNKPRDYWLTERDGALMGFPIFETPNNQPGVGYFTIELTVGESDASNVRDYLLKGAKKIEEEKPNILKAIGAQ